MKCWFIVNLLKEFIYLKDKIDHPNFIYLKIISISQVLPNKKECNVIFKLYFANDLHTFQNIKYQVYMRWIYCFDFYYNQRKILLLFCFCLVDYATT